MNKTILYGMIASLIGLIGCIAICKKKNKKLNDKYERLIKDIVAKDVESN